VKRSRINGAIEEAIWLLEKHRFHLPPFAYWSRSDWQDRSQKTTGMIKRKLGWDVTEFGLGRFDDVGLTLFTLRNGSPEDLKHGTGMLYAEKALITKVNQVTPMHFHWSKTEDIINRGGGRLAIKLYKATPSDGLGTDDVSFLSDGMEHTVPAGGVFRLAPGESITLPPRLYHSFWAEGEPVLAGEVSTVNDDELDNRFFESIGRFPSIEEDEPASYLLVSDYATHLLP
jgi:D-lyxose ketol-isomerase